MNSFLNYLVKRKAAPYGRDVRSLFIVSDCNQAQRVRHSKMMEGTQVPYIAETPRTQRPFTPRCVPFCVHFRAVHASGVLK